MEAREIMARDVVALSPDMTVAEARDVLLRDRIHGAPVVDQADRLVGMVSLIDLVARTGETVHEVMAAGPVSAFEDTPVEELARTMLDQMVRRVPILRGGRVVGIVSASDIIRVFLDLQETAPAEQHAGT